MNLKYKLVSFLPYLFLGAFFVGVVFLNINRNVEKPVYSNEIKTETDEIIQTLPEKISDEKDEAPQESEKTQTVIVDEISEDSEAVTDCYYTKNGTKFHSKPDCRYLKNSSIIIRTTYENAKFMDLTPCSGCAG